MKLPRSVGAQYATGDQWRNNSRKNEDTELKQKQHLVVDVTGDGSKVQCCKEQCCIGTWRGIAFLSRADREIAVFRHVAPPSRLRLEIPHQTASSEVRGEGREPLADKAGESTLLSRSRGEKGLR